MLTESLSPLAQAVFGMTTLQMYNAPKIFSGSIFFFSQNGPACSSLIHSPSCLEAMLSFPCTLPMQADKKRGTRTSLRSYNGTPFAQPPHQPFWEGKRGDWGWEREPYLRVPFPIPKHDFQSIPRYGGGKRSQLLAHIQLHELGDGVIALERAGVRAVVEHGTESLILQPLGVQLREMGAKPGKLRAQLHVLQPI